ncbi:MAG: TolC family protein [Elusimicrobia bacterium]|nr:TolC family protein [Candidatus Obscuribacterium magneticum]
MKSILFSKKIPFFLLCSLCSLFLFSSLQAGIPTLEIGLFQAEDEALRTSAQIQSARVELAAAHSQARSQFALLWPRLSLDATYRHISEVPSLQPAPTSPSIELGDNKNYSYGPTLNWQVWSSGGLYYSWKSLAALERAKAEELKNIERQVLLRTRLAYFQVQLALEQVRDLIDSLQLAQAQYKDIRLQQRAGSRSRIDALSAHQDVLSRRRQLRQARADLASNLRELFSLTQLGKNTDASLPIDEEDAEDLPADTEKPTLIIKLDPLNNSESYLKPAARGTPDENHPASQTLMEVAWAYRSAAGSAGSNHWPTLQLSARSSRDYPNGPIKESFTQNTLAASASWPLFESGRVANNVKEQKGREEASLKQRDQVLLNLQRDWDKAQDQLKGLRVQEEIIQQSVKETKELADLTYDSYQAGRSSYLEVQTANLRALDAHVQFAQTKVQILIQLAVLDALGKGIQP